MTNIGISLLVLGLSASLALNVVLFWWLKHHLRRCAGRQMDWEADEKARHEARWYPEVRTSGCDISVELERVAISSTGRKVLSSIGVGEVSTLQEGWEEDLDALVVNARARLATLNALADAAEGLASRNAV